MLLDPAGAAEPLPPKALDALDSTSRSAAASGLIVLARGWIRLGVGSPPRLAFAKMASHPLRLGRSQARTSSAAQALSRPDLRPANLSFARARRTPAASCPARANFPASFFEPKHLGETPASAWAFLSSDFFPRLSTLAAVDSIAYAKRACFSTKPANRFPAFFSNAAKPWPAEAFKGADLLAGLDRLLL